MKAAPRIISRKIKMLSSELRMLQSYKTDMEILYEDYKSEFFRNMTELESKCTPQEEEKPAPDEASSGADTLTIDPSSSEQRWRKTEDGWERDDEGSSPDESQEPEEEVDNAPAWAKKLYKKIAMLAHPDRTLNEAEARKSKLNKLFTDSAQAMSDGNWKKLLGYALELDIPVEDGPATIPMLEERIKTLKVEIAEVQSSLEWLWGEHFGVHEVRMRIAAGFLAKKNIPMKNEDLVTIIREMEKASEERGSD